MRSTLEGDGDSEAKEEADLVKNRKRFASRLVNGLHGEAWKAVEGLLTDTEPLREGGWIQSSVGMPAED